MIRVGIVGATGYAGAELVRLLEAHPDVEIVWLSSKSYADKTFSSIYANMYKFVDVELLEDNLAEYVDEVDVVFTATPQGYLSNLLTKEILAKTKVIDLSADYRLTDLAVYEQWYKLKHGSPELIESAVYGLCEINRDKIKSTRLLANPGCYTTTSIMALYPLVHAGVIDGNSIIIDAKSGTSGAGRGAKVDNLYCEVNENIKAYGVASHRHTPEIEQLLKQAGGEDITINFTPHLVPMNRGILVTAYANLSAECIEAGNVSEEIRNIYEDFYEDEFFVRLYHDGTPVQTKWVEGSNFIDISYVIDERTGRIIVMAAIDNLIKGAAGQAVQNMNIMFGVDEKKGIRALPMYP